MFKLNKYIENFEPFQQDSADQDEIPNICDNLEKKAKDALDKSKFSNKKKGLINNKNNFEFKLFKNIKLFDLKSKITKLEKNDTNYSPDNKKIVGKYIDVYKQEAGNTLTLDILDEKIKNETQAENDHYSGIKDQLKIQIDNEGIKQKLYYTFDIVDISKINSYFEDLVDHKSIYKYDSDPLFKGNIQNQIFTDYKNFYDKIGTGNKRHLELVLFLVSYYYEIYKYIYDKNTQSMKDLFTKLELNIPLDLRNDPYVKASEILKPRLKNEDTTKTKYESFLLNICRFFNLYIYSTTKKKNLDPDLQTDRENVIEAMEIAFNKQKFSKASSIKMFISEKIEFKNFHEKTFSDLEYELYLKAILDPVAIVDNGVIVNKDINFIHQQIIIDINKVHKYTIWLKDNNSKLFFEKNPSKIDYIYNQFFEIGTYTSEILSTYSEKRIPSKFQGLEINLKKVSQFLYDYKDSELNKPLTTKTFREYFRKVDNKLTESSESEYLIKDYVFEEFNLDLDSQKATKDEILYYIKYIYLMEVDIKKNTNLLNNYNKYIERLEEF